MKAESCENYGEDQTCFKAVSHNNIACREKSFYEEYGCEINEKWSKCDDINYEHDALFKYLCVGFLSHDEKILGNDYIRIYGEYCKDAFGAYTACNADNTACLQTKDDYGDPCDPDEFTERCDGNTAVYCNDSVVTTLSCDNAAEGGEAGMCYFSSTANYADCYTESDVTANACTIPSTDMYCDDETYEHAAFLTYSCAEFKRSDGSKNANLYYMSSGYFCTNADETAYTICNDDYTACSDVLEGT